MAKRKKISWGSIVTGIGVGTITGWYLNDLPIFSNLNIPIYIYYVIPILFMIYLGYRKPVTTEYIGYATSGFVGFQFLWDYKFDLSIS